MRFDPFKILSWQKQQPVIAIIEDDLVLRKVLARTVRDAEPGVFVACFARNSKAIDLFDYVAPIGVFMDLFRAGGTGYDLLKSHGPLINPRMRRTTFVIVSGSGKSLEERNRCYELGARVVLPKPFDIEEIKFWVRLMVRPMKAFGVT